MACPVPAPLPKTRDQFRNLHQPARPRDPGLTPRAGNDDACPDGVERRTTPDKTCLTLSKETRFGPGAACRHGKRQTSSRPRATHTGSTPVPRSSFVREALLHRQRPIGVAARAVRRLRALVVEAGDEHDLTRAG